VDNRWTRDGPHYGAVLVLLTATFSFLAAAPPEAWTGPVKVVLAGSTLLLALSTTPQVGRRMVRIAEQLVALALVASLIALFAASSHTGLGTSGILTALMVATIPGAIVLGVKDQPSVTAQSVFGAICVYLLIGLFFSVVFGVIGEFGSAPFFANGLQGTSNAYLYFSFVTMTTTGYGDYTAASDLGRTLAVTEALVGQLYIVTVLALVVTRFSGALRRRGT